MIAESPTCLRLRPDLESAPIVEADVTYFVDRSCFRDHLLNHAGYVSRLITGC